MSLQQSTASAIEHYGVRKQIQVRPSPKRSFSLNDMALSYCAAEASKISRTRLVSVCSDKAHPPCNSKPTITPATAPIATIARNSMPARIALW